MDNIKKVEIDKLSYTSVQIKLNSDVNDTKVTLATATAFYYKFDNKYFLITNWHNVSGFNPETGQRISKTTLASPTHVEAPFQKTKNPISWGRWNIPLYDEKKIPKWLIHPKYKSKVDVAIIELGKNDNPDGVSLRAINEIELDNIKPRIADDVFILGFPHGFTSGGNFPIWKRGTIASEPDIDLDNLPKILVDTASRSGMSGAPVIYRRTGIHGLIDGNMVDESIIGEIQNFVGIYSGRLSDNKEVCDRTKEELDTQLGTVWKESVIKEILEGNVRDDCYYVDESTLD